MSKQRQKLLQELFGSFWVMQASMKSMHGWSQRAAHQPTKQQFELLFAVKQLDQPSIKELAERLDITSGAVSQLVEHMEQTQLVERVESEQDRRTVRVRLTRRGANLFRHFHARRMAKVDEYLSVLSDDELAQFVGLLQKIMVNARQKAQTKLHKKLKPKL